MLVMRVNRYSVKRADERGELNRRDGETEIERGRRREKERIGRHACKQRTSFQ